MKNIFVTNRKVVLQEIDQLNHVNNIVYLQWVQEISEQHWKKLTEDNPQNDLIWVVLRHEIDYLASAFLNDTITMKTWVGETSGFKSIRHVEILRDQKLLASTKTTWCLLDAQKHRPIKIPEKILTLLQPNF